MVVVKMDPDVYKLTILLIFQFSLFTILECIYIQRQWGDFFVALATNRLSNTCSAWVQAME
jgi:hypothetical protein